MTSCIAIHDRTFAFTLLGFHGNFRPMSPFPVSFEKENQLLQRMAALGIAESDLQEWFIRGGGPGGQ